MVIPWAFAEIDVEDKCVVVVGKYALAGRVAVGDVGPDETDDIVDDCRPVVKETIDDNVFCATERDDKVLTGDVADIDVGEDKLFISLEYGVDEVRNVEDVLMTSVGW